MFLTRFEPDDVAGADVFDRSAFALRATAAGEDDQRLTERMGMPCGASAGLEGYRCTADTRRCRPVERRIDADRSGEIIRRSLADGSEPFRLIFIFRPFVSSGAWCSADVRKKI
ncbi:hypothetical protein RGCCGE502_13954 [Rhizobium grahamii CCGE 502]|uniref:Uncharacterized protein n=1 Tax=Rhizobium grahamii CCGE 502 TaxID=990285 RepID=S3HGH8_9HYPH|nr:hypothetical protein RGCCGE502_13954 [Rhizobium grahamii CCGE 502]